MNFFALDSDFTHETLKVVYREACKKYHPDINSAGLAMMIIVNDAYETLQKHEGPRPGNFQTAEDQAKARAYPEHLIKAMNIAKEVGLEIEICGNWAWLYGDTRPHKVLLKNAGFKWAPNKMRWYFRPEDYKSSNRDQNFTMDDIRAKYGSQEYNDDQTERKTRAFQGVIAQ